MVTDDRRSDADAGYVVHSPVTTNRVTCASAAARTAWGRPHMPSHSNAESSWRRGGCQRYCSLPCGLRGQHRQHWHHRSLFIYSPQKEGPASWESCLVSSSSPRASKQNPGGFCSRGALLPCWLDRVTDRCIAFPIDFSSTKTLLLSSSPLAL